MDKKFLVIAACEKQLLGAALGADAARARLTGARERTEGRLGGALL